MTASATFDLLRKRLAAAAETLRAKSDALNAKRISTFGRIEPKLLARLSARTEHNCVARDIVRVGELLLFGYEVTLGLKKETKLPKNTILKIGQTSGSRHGDSGQNTGWLHASSFTSRGSPENASTSMAFSASS